MNQNVNLDLIPKFAVFGNLYFSQYDVGRTATINLLNGAEAYTIPVGATVKIQATKPSGLGFSETCTFSGNVVTVVSTETMTDEAGRIPCELRIEYNGEVLGTANFTFNVERSPHPEGTTDGTAESILNDITVAYNHAMDQIENAGGLTVAIKNALLNCFQKVAWIDEHGQDYYDALADELFAVTGITLNSSTLLFNSIGSTQQLTASLIPSTSTATVTWSSSDSTVVTVSSSGLVTSVANGNATITASVGSVSATCSVTVSVATVTSISAVLNASGHTFYVGDPVDDIKPYLTVTATYSDSTTQTVPSGSYTLSGSLSNVGANTITVSYGGQSTTVTVNAISAELVSISAVYTQSGTVYDTDSLDSLKSDLVVTATYSDSSTETVASADYTLSGTLVEGTSTVTVSYMGITTTFNVAVAHQTNSWSYDPSTDGLLSVQSYISSASVPSGCTESIVDGKLHLYVPQNSSTYIEYKFAQEGTTNATIKARVKFNNVSQVNAWGYGFVLSIGNSDGKAIISQRRLGASQTWVTFDGGTYYDTNVSYTLDTWYDIELTIANGKQSCKIDGTTIYSDRNLGTIYPINVIQARTNTSTQYTFNADIESIEYIEE